MKDDGDNTLLILTSVVHSIVINVMDLLLQARRALWKRLDWVFAFVTSIVTQEHRHMDVCVLACWEVDTYHTISPINTPLLHLVRHSLRWFACRLVSFLPIVKGIQKVLQLNYKKYHHWCELQLLCLSFQTQIIYCLDSGHHQQNTVDFETLSRFIIICRVVELHEATVMNSLLGNYVLDCNAGISRYIKLRNLLSAPVANQWSIRFVILRIVYTVFQKNGHPFYFFHNSLKWWSIYTKFLPDVAEEMLIQNIWTKYGC